MRLYIKKLDNFDINNIDYESIEKTIPNNETKFFYIDREFDKDLFTSHFEEKISDKNKKSVGVTNYSSIYKGNLEFVFFVLNKNDSTFIFEEEIKIEELNKDIIKSICLLKIRNNCVVYGTLAGNNFSSNNIDIFISKLFNKEITSNFIPNFNILKKIKSNEIKGIIFNITSNKNYNELNGNKGIINLIKSMSNVLFNNGKNYSSEKNDLKLKMSLSFENNKKKNGYNNYELFRDEAINLINDDDFINQYEIHLKGGDIIKSSELLLSKIINTNEEINFKTKANNIFSEMDIFFDERLKDINEVLQDD